ncbi:MAG: riboflavin synthase [Pirellulaceae bacterium]|nr:riboflavin synthase [Pirellulaceae bacterium]
MFTGLIEGVSKLVAVVRQGSGLKLSFDLGPLADGVSIGHSIAISGCCLTAISVQGTIVDFEAGEETLTKTGLGRLKTNGLVNIERSLRVGDRMGGHFVTGHVDGQGVLTKRIEDGPWANFHFAASAPLLGQMASKGSITIDGVSLTLVEVNDQEFSVALIPHTLSVTTLGSLTEGDSVNLETDILAKYAQRISIFPNRPSHV